VPDYSVSTLSTCLGPHDPQKNMLRVPPYVLGAPQGSKGPPSRHRGAPKEGTLMKGPPFGPPCLGPRFPLIRPWTGPTMGLITSCSQSRWSHQECITKTKSLIKINTVSPFSVRSENSHFIFNEALLTGIREILFPYVSELVSSPMKLVFRVRTQTGGEPLNIVSQMCWKQLKSKSPSLGIRRSLMRKSEIKSYFISYQFFFGSHSQYRITIPLIPFLKL
jgi:hypothetical protein